MNDLLIAGVLAAFALMGFTALIAPARVTRQFGIGPLGRDARNEVRAVYGGFGLVMAGMLAVALVVPGLRYGICVTIGAALAGMAGGRMLSGALDRSMGGPAALFLLVEVLGAAALVYAA